LVLRGLVAVALAGLVGCKQQLFLEPGDYVHAVTANLPPNLETNPHAAITPPVVDKHGPDPATVLDPTRPPRFVSLKECIAVALEQGNIGSQGLQQFGFKNEVANQFNGRTVGGTDTIRAFAVDPAVAGADIERSLSKFDARWITSMTWQKVDQPVAAQFLSFQQQRDASNVSTTLAKPLPTGGVAGITFSVDYSKFATQSITQAGFTNPNYTPRLQFTFEQPLLQLFGVEVNQLTSSHPGSSLIPGLRPSGGQGVDGILITRIRFDQARAEFERNVNFLLVNVEAAYWNLYSSYYNLYAQEEGLRQSYEGYRFTFARVQAGNDPPQQLNQARAQLELFRSQVYTARGQVLESERQLRGLMGLRSDEGNRLVPIDEPNLAPYKPDFYEAANEALAFRPELLQARQELKVQQLNLLLQKNLRRPDLRTFSTYDVAGLGTRLDGSEQIGAGGLTPGNALASLGNNQFNSWSVGLRLDMPLGFRDANALVRQAQLQLTRSYLQLRDSELKTVEFLVSRYRRVVLTHAVIAPLRARREELQVFVYRFRTRIDIGQYRSEEYFNYLQVQRDLADAIAREYAAIAEYNSALAEFEFAKGTGMRYNNVNLSEGPLPPWVQKRAADHERERTAAAIKVRERPAHDPAALSPPHPLGPGVGTPFLPALADLPPSPQLPDPRPVDPKQPAAPAPMPGAKSDAAAPTPLPVPLANRGGQPLPAPAPLPLPGGGGAGLPEPGEIFTPAGSVTVPRFKPIAPPVREPGGPTDPPVRLPPGAATDYPTAPPLPTGTGAIPPSFQPPAGATRLPVPTSADYPPN
jgi:outer membrane protein TolC